MILTLYEPFCKHINLAANVCGYTPINLGKKSNKWYLLKKLEKFIKNG